jgi:hypothetical protein
MRGGRVGVEADVREVVVKQLAHARRDRGWKRLPTVALVNERRLDIPDVAHIARGEMGGEIAAHKGRTAAPGEGPAGRCYRTGVVHGPEVRGRFVARRRIRQQPRSLPGGNVVERLQSALGRRASRHVPEQRQGRAGDRRLDRREEQRQIGRFACTFRRQQARQAGRQVARSRGVVDDGAITASLVVLPSLLQRMRHFGGDYLA